jgi:hypothetical protein
MGLQVNEHTGFPPTFLNAYIVDELKQFDDRDGNPLVPSGPLPFEPMFPAQNPTNMEDIYNDEIFIRNNPTALSIVFDRLVRFRPNAFYRHKREQLVYFIYCPDLTKLFDATRIIIDCLDREDAAAQDLNAWVANKTLFDSKGNAIEPNVFFHNIKVYQADEARDIAELASARTLFLNKLVIEYDYHTKDIVSSSRYT